MKKEVKVAHILTLTQILKIVNDTFYFLGCDELVGTIDVKLVNLKTIAGDASFDRKIIRISSHFLKHNNKDKIKELIIHESCHIVNDYFRSISNEWRKFDSKNKSTNGHGEGWSFLMKFLSYEPNSQIYTLNGIPFYVNNCYDCPNRDILTHNLYLRIKNGSSKRYCSNCKSIIRSERITKRVLTEQ